MPPSHVATDTVEREGKSPKRTGRLILIGLLLGLLCGVFFGEYCQPLQVIGYSYVGLLQMTVLPYLIFSLITKLGRLGLAQAKRLALTSAGILLGFWAIGILLIVFASTLLPPLEGASFFSPRQDLVAAEQEDFLLKFIPTNVFRSLSSEYVPAIIVFCLFFGSALMVVPGKEPLLNILDICCDGIGRINQFLVRLAPLGLFTLSAAAAGTLRVEELSRLQAYLIVLTLTCVMGAFGVLPLLVSSLTRIRIRDFLKAAQEPVLTAIATGKLFVVLPQIQEKCELLLSDTGDSPSQRGDSNASVIVPLAYAFPHLGKILTFTFISFAAWYVGRGLSPAQTTGMAASGTISSFASPLITMPYLLDRYQLPQDLMLFFILPGFVTTRIGDVVGVIHLMAFTVVVNQTMLGRVQIRWRHLATGVCMLLVCALVAGGATWRYLSSSTLDYDLDERLLALEVAAEHPEVVVHKSQENVPLEPQRVGPTLDWIEQSGVLRVGYHPDHLPYSYFNSAGELVGFDVELMYQLAAHLQIRLEFVPFMYDTVIEQLESGQIDLAIGGLIMKPERLFRIDFSQPYQTATMAVILADHRRGELDKWDDPHTPSGFRLAVLHEDIAAAARRRLPDVDVVVIDSLSSFFTNRQQNLDGLAIAAEEGAAWNVLYPDYTVVIPEPIVKRPVGIAVRRNDAAFLRFINQWLEFERLEGTLDRLRSYWVEGGGTEQHLPRWCIVRDVLHWLP